MPVLLDLDDTLVDRSGAFARWAAEAVPAWDGDAADVEWLLRADGRGRTPREVLAQGIVDRFPTAGSDVDGLVAALRREVVARNDCYPGVVARLRELADLGESLVVVTNGDAWQQRATIERTGIADLVTGSVISGALGVKKPDARIFAAAPEIAGPGRTWMVGDDIEADMAGGRAVGLEAAWVSQGRPWTPAWSPTLEGRDPADVLAAVARAIRDAG
ncbi:HAD family hydrolase [Clavibacter tessellarius]|uniref:HAD family hydrolase n=1 Tax=Clavibacter tessellarius TaxID=31965 RepID=UPI0039EAFD5C